MSLGTPLYFGSANRARSGFVHWPTGPVRGGAVVCPPLGYEDVCAHTALRRLAERLAGRGVVTVRLDYDGTGNSMGDETDPDRVGAWSTSIDDVVEQLERWGVGSLTLIGLRFGATLAAAAASRHAIVASTVLWDPVRSGRRYGRALRMLSAPTDGRDEVQVGNDGPEVAQPGAVRAGGISVAGVWFGADTMAAIDATILLPETLRVPTLVVLRTGHDRETNQWIAPANPVLGTSVLDVRVRPGMAELIDADAELAIVPEALLDEICDWVGARPMATEHGHAATATFPSDLRTSTVEVLNPETSLRHQLRRFGPDRLFGVDTVRDGSESRHCLITLNNGVARSIGPGGAWVELARRAAAQGWRVVRLDISGIGESPARAGAAENDSYPITTADDVGSVIATLREDGVESFVLAGLCSGALLGFDAALDHPEIAAIVSINGRFDAVFSDRRADRRRRAGGYTNPLIGIPLRKTPLLPYFEKVPFWAWAGLDRVGLVASPVQALETVLGQGVRVAMVFGPAEWGLRALRRRGGKRFRKIQENPMTTVVKISGLDHSMFDPTSRAEVMGFLLRYLESFGIPTRVLVPTSS